MVSTPEVDVVIAVAREAGELILQAFNACHNKQVVASDAARSDADAAKGPMNFSTKINSRDLVTETDWAAQNLIVRRLKEMYPHNNDKFLCEEDSTPDQVLSDDATWVVDPLDGTMNFVHGFPFVAVSIAYYVKKEPLIGVVHNCILDETFSAAAGQGAWLSTQRGGTLYRIHPSTSRDTLKECIVALGFSVPLIGYSGAAAEESLGATPGAPAGAEDILVTQSRSLEETVRCNFRSLLSRCRDLRRLGSCALELCYVACGRLDAASEIGVKEWDLAAGVLILREAQGCTLEPGSGQRLKDIGSRNYIAACSEKVALEIASCVRRPDISVRSLETQLVAARRRDSAGGRQH